MSLLFSRFALPHSPVLQASISSTNDHLQSPFVSQTFTSFSDNLKTSTQKIYQQILMLQ